MLCPVLFLLSEIPASLKPPRPPSCWAWGQLSPRARGPAGSRAAVGKGLGSVPWFGRRPSVCLPRSRPPCRWIRGYTSPSALTQARLSSPAATGHCQGKWISTLINPWPDLPPSFSWFFQELCPSTVSSLGLQRFGNSLLPSLPPLAQFLPFRLSDLYFSPSLFSLVFMLPGTLERKLASFPFLTPLCRSGARAHGSEEEEIPNTTQKHSCASRGMVRLQPHGSARGTRLRPCSSNAQP